MRSKWVILGVEKRPPRERSKANGGSVSVANWAGLVSWGWGKCSKRAMMGEEKAAGG